MQAPPVVLILAPHCARVANPQLVLPEGLLPHQSARASVRAVTTRAAIMTVAQMARDRIGRSVARWLPATISKLLARKPSQAVLNGDTRNPTAVDAVQLARILENAAVHILVVGNIGGIGGGSFGVFRFCLGRIIVARDAPAAIP